LGFAFRITQVAGPAGNLGGFHAKNLAKTDSVTKSQDLQTTVFYSAVDSTVLDADKQVVHLYGNAKVKYGEISLESSYIRLDWDKNEVYAIGRYDSTSHKMEGLPVFTQGADKYDSDEIRYNFKTKRAAIKGIVTQQGEGYVQGKTVKKDEEDNLYIRNAIYTTCNLSHPHFHIKASKIKVVGKKEIISGPFHFELNDIPLPIGLPFGFSLIPNPERLGNRVYWFLPMARNLPEEDFTFEKVGIIGRQVKILAFVLQAKFIPKGAGDWERIHNTISVIAIQEVLI